jgi:hypothetical protein
MISYRRRKWTLRHTEKPYTAKEVRDLHGLYVRSSEIWKENDVDFANPINLVPVAAGIVIAIGNTSLVFSKTFSLSGIAFGTIVAIGAYHMAHALAPQHLKNSAGGAVVIVGTTDTEKEELNVH